MIKLVTIYFLLMILSISCNTEKEKEEIKEESYEEREHRIEQQIENISKSLRIPILTDSAFTYTIDYQTYLPSRNFITDFYIEDIYIENDTPNISGQMFLDNIRNIYYQLTISSELLNKIKPEYLKRVIANIRIDTVPKISFKLKTEQIDDASQPEISIDLDSPILLKGRCLEIFKIE